MEKSSFGNQKYFKWKCLNWIHLKKIVRKKSFFSKVVHFWRFPTTRKMNYFTKETFFSEKIFSNGFSLNIFIWRIFDYQNLIFPFRCSQVLGTFFLTKHTSKLVWLMVRGTVALLWHNAKQGVSTFQNANTNGL